MAISDNDIINKFREMVSKRYIYYDLNLRFHLSKEINEEIIWEIKTYFLESIYPEAIKRKELEVAFAGLGSYVRSPRKIWGLLGNMSKALVKFGFQFPTALKAGMSALDSFLGAKKFENEMVAKAQYLRIDDLVSDESFEKVMAQLPKEDIEKFINDVDKLFKIMTNTSLIYKTIEILDNVVITMKRKPKVYPSNEIDGILLGRAILQKGYELFSKYDKTTKDLMVDVVNKNEIWYTNEVYKKWSS